MHSETWGINKKGKIIRTDYTKENFEAIFLERGLICISTLRGER